LTPSQQTPERNTPEGSILARSISLACALLLLSLTAFALGRHPQTPQAPQQPQQQTEPQPAPYQDSFPVAHPVTHHAASSLQAPSPQSRSPQTSSPQTPAASATPAAAAPSPKLKSPAERLFNAVTSLPPLPFHPDTIVIDPAHGGADSGSRISDSTVEKDVTLALAFRLRSLLTARGFNVVLTRADDKAANTTPPFAPLTLDDRAGIANHQRASACLLLHATARGNGIHLYTSELTPAEGEQTIEPWLTAQAPWVTQSQRLANSLGDAFNRARIPLVDGSASVRPLDSLTCPALVLELAPDTDDPDSINDAGFQQRVAQAAANALILWKSAVQPPPHIAPPAPSSTETTP